MGAIEPLERLNTDRSCCSSFEKAYPDLSSTADSADVLVIGISSGSVEELAAWKAKNKLNYPVLSDDDKRVARKAMGVGKAMMGMSEARATFFIDKKGIVRAVLDGGLSFVIAEYA